MGKKIKPAILAFAMLLLILDAKTASYGAAQGVGLCIRVLIPSLLPFFLISALFTNSLAETTCRPVRYIGRMLNIPENCEALFLIGLMGGYPVGAKMVAQAAERGIVDKKDARDMMSFCNNPGPAFLFGVLSLQFPNAGYIGLMWGIIVLCAMLTAVLLPQKCLRATRRLGINNLTVAQAMEGSIRSMASVCGWVITFRMVLAFLDRWFLWLLPGAFRAVVHLLTELANGSALLPHIESIGLRFAICTASAAMGGLCVFLQTVSVCGSLGVGKYLIGKLIQTCLCLLVAFPVGYVLENGGPALLIASIFFCVAVLIPILSFYRKNHKKRYGNLKTIGV